MVTRVVTHLVTLSSFGNASRQGLSMTAEFDNMW